MLYDTTTNGSFHRSHSRSHTHTQTRARSNRRSIPCTLFYHLPFIARCIWARAHFGSRLSVSSNRRVWRQLKFLSMRSASVRLLSHTRPTYSSTATVRLHNARRQQWCGDEEHTIKCAWIVIPIAIQASSLHFTVRYKFRIAYSYGWWCDMNVRASFHPYFHSKSPGSWRHRSFYFTISKYSAFFFVHNFAPSSGHVMMVQVSSRLLTPRWPCWLSVRSHESFQFFFSFFFWFSCACVCDTEDAIIDAIAIRYPFCHSVCHMRAAQRQRNFHLAIGLSGTQSK